MLTNINIIFKKELKSYFNTPMAYIFLVVFAIVTGYFFTNTFFLFNQSNMRALFNIVPLVYLFFIPAITMGLIAREKNIGTMEVISTLPIKDVEFVVGKFLSALSLIALGLAFTLIHFFTLMNVGTNIDYGAVFTGYLGLLMLGAVYASVGTFASSVTDNQVIAFIISVFIVLVFFLMDKMLHFMPVSIAGLIQYISVDYHLSNISRGVIDSRNIIYFASLIGLFLFTTVRVLEIRKWR
ncbi:MAG: ABC transporter permease subunit [Candidatus Marinimicrobia bacterium]|jgi:ABC-2 type transport system permease protein|nr:ABC transporter permease subunit [Candidatus Neomarinimicrobiota bacterium]MBT5956593.1 ABC transporter permease subunit [Candidatus Neomarinimicrobiota bacterium]MBT6870011.1 ABC transporter permease subunit [Candidatus Neomarinimicrobiota bacterium]MBT7378041.1 ABC transporter permease subunit [Candidatus Neomarinimicrobiota bacterium]|tara:strand:- start:2660 stop:3376 length:717 start_codon:yes stop_codon:yes gene_type:complete